MSREGDVAEEAARLWANRDPEALLSSARDLSSGTATDRSLPASARELASRGEAISLLRGRYESIIITCRVTAPPFMISRKSLTSSSEPRVVIISSSLSRPCM